MARPLLLTGLLALLPFTACATAPAPDWQGNAAQATAAETLVASDPAGWQQVWTKVGQAAPRDLPNDTTAVAVFAGQKRTGGYSVEFVAVQDGASAVTVTYRIRKPRFDEMVTQALTSPYAIQLVSNQGKPVTVQEVR